MTTIAAPVVVTLWAIWAIYWAVSSLTGKTRQRGDRGLAVWAYRGPVVLAAFFLIAPRLSIMDTAWGPRSAVLCLIGMLVVVVGLLLTVWARLYLGAQWTGRVGLNADHRLVRTGPYRFVRHPIYSGILLALVGTVLAFQEWTAIVALVLAIVALSLKLRREEKWMSEHFKEDYVDYRAKVAAIVPLLL